jgi:hypothetical protein
MGTVLVTADVKRVKNIYRIRYQYFGAKYDGINDDAIAIQKTMITHLQGKLAK